MEQINKIDILKGHYECVSMSELQFQKIKDAIERGKAERRRASFYKYPIAAGFAAVLVLFLILPNIQMQQRVKRTLA